MELKNNFFECGIKSYLDDKFNIDFSLVFSRFFEEILIKEIYFVNVLYVRKLSRENDLKKGDSILLSNLKEISKLLFDNLEKEIESNKLKENLSPNSEKVFHLLSTHNFDKNLAKINMIKVKLINSIFTFVLGDKNDSDTLTECRKHLKNGFECLNIMATINSDRQELNNFLNNVVYQMPGIESDENKKLVNIIEEVLQDMEIEEEFIKELQKNLKEKSQVTLKKAHTDSVSRISNANTNIFTNRRRNSSLDKNESVEREKEDIKEKNHRIDRYFKPAEKKKTNYSFNSLLLGTKKNLNSKFNQYSNSSNNSNHNSNFINSSNDNLNSDLSYATFADKLENSRNSPSRSEKLISLSKKDSVSENSFLLNSNSNLIPLSVYENSRTFTESTMKRPMNLSSNVYNFSSAKSTTSGSYLSQFSFNPIINSKYTSGSKTINSISDMDSVSVMKMRSGIGLNSLLATKICQIPKTKKNKHSRNILNKKRKCREKVVLVEKLKEKYANKILANFNQVKKNQHENIDVISNNNSNTSLHLRPHDSKEKQHLKNFVNINFYHKKLMKLSPDITLHKISDENKPENELLSHKRKMNDKEKNYEACNSKSLTTAKISRSHNSINSFNITSQSRSRSMSADDEVLVYQTPIKTETFKNSAKEKNKNGSPSPGATTRKNLFNLFKQIEKSG